MENSVVIIVVVGVLMLLANVLVVISLTRLVLLWLAGVRAGALIPLGRIARMKLKRLPAKLVVLAYIDLSKGGVPVDLDALEAHVLAGGNLTHVVQAVLAAKNADFDLSVETACARDLAGEDILKSVT